MQLIKRQVTPMRHLYHHGEHLFMLQCWLRLLQLNNPFNHFCSAGNKHEKLFSTQKSDTVYVVGSEKG